MGFSSLFTVIFLCLCIYHCGTLASTNSSSNNNIRLKEKEVFDILLDPVRYDKRIHPPFYINNGTVLPAIVYVNMFIRTITKVDDAKMEYNIQITFRQLWADDRLRYDHIEGTEQLRFLTAVDISKMWIPDLFFSNEKEGHFHDIILPNEYTRIYPTGTVLYSTRITLTLSCPMNLRYMPFDKQVCSIRMASYGYTTDDVIFLWKEGDPVQVVRNLQIKKFTLERFLTDYCNSVTNTGEYSCIKVDFLFKREISYYLARIFIPSLMLVILSWLAFWIDGKSVTGRLLLGISTLLALSYQITTFNSSEAVVNYIRAIDIWCWMALTFIFASIIESITVQYLLKREQKKNLGNIPENDVENDLTDKENNGSEATKTTETETVNESKPLKVTKIYSSLVSRIPKSKSKKIDIFSRILFPLLFFIFIIGFLMACCQTSEE